MRGALPFYLDAKRKKKDQERQDKSLKSLQKTLKQPKLTCRRHVQTAGYFFTCFLCYFFTPFALRLVFSVALSIVLCLLPHGQGIFDCELQENDPLFAKTLQFFSKKNTLFKLKISSNVVKTAIIYYFYNTSEPTRYF